MRHNFCGFKKYISVLAVSSLILCGCNNKKSIDEINGSSDKSIQDTKSNVTSEGTSDYASMKLDTKVTKDEYDDGSAFSEFNVTGISLSDNEIIISGDGASSSCSVVTVSKEGVYRISGSLTEGCIVVDAADSYVNLIFDNVNLYSSKGSPVYVEDAKKVLITLADGSDNSLTDKTANSSAEDNSENESSTAAIYSKDNLTIGGSGTLNITGNCNGVISKNQLKVMSGKINIDVANNALRGKEYVTLYDGTFKINAGNNAIKSYTDNTETAGFVKILGGTYDINADDNGIYGEYLTEIGGGTLNITTDNKKGIKSCYSILITGGNININSKDDAIHSDGDVNISGGKLTINTEDDAVHAENSLTISDGEYNIQSCYEGFEAPSITLSGGTGTLVARDDGINANGGGNEFGGGMGRPGGGMERPDGNMERPDGGKFPEGNRFPDGEFNSPNTENAPDNNDSVNNNTATAPANNENNRPGKPENGTVESQDNNNQGKVNTGNNMVESIITISGGTHKIYADGDGIDSNGKIIMTGGFVEVHGPTNNGNGALDYDESFTITGGTLLAAGSSGMAQSVTPDGCYALMVNFNLAQSKGTVVTIDDKGGNQVANFTSEKTFSNIVVCTPKLTSGEYSLLTDGNSLCTFTISEASTGITSDGSPYSGGSGFGGGHGGGGRFENTPPANKQ